MEALKSAPDVLLEMKEWIVYVEQRRRQMEEDDKKVQQLQQHVSDGSPSAKRWHSKPKKGTTPKAEPAPMSVSAPAPAPVPAAPQDYASQMSSYANGQAGMYPQYYVPNPTMPQGYSSFSYYYGAYPQPPRPPQYR